MEHTIWGIENMQTRNTMSVMSKVRIWKSRWDKREEKEKQQNNTEHGLILYRTAEEAHLTSTFQRFKLPVPGESAVLPTNNTVWIWPSRYMVNIVFCLEVFAQDKKKKKKKWQNAKLEKTQAHIFKRAPFSFCASYLSKRCHAHRFPLLSRHSFWSYKAPQFRSHRIRYQLQTCSRQTTPKAPRRPLIQTWRSGPLSPTLARVSSIQNKSLLHSQAVIQDTSVDQTAMGQLWRRPTLI